MRRTALYVAAWFAAGAFAVTLATVGVSMVSDRVTDDNRPAPLSAAEVQDQLEGTTDGGPDDPAATTTTTAPVDPPVTPVERSPGRSDGPSTTAPGRATPSGGSGSGPTDAPTTTTTTPPPAPAVVTRTYSMVGGTATLRFTPGGVTVLAATPNGGFSVKISDVHDGGTRVEFEGEDHRSRVDGWWASGPRDEVREED